MARDLLTDLPESVTLPRDVLFSMIKPAIAIWQLQTNDDPQRRQNFIVASAPIAIAAGEADISAEVEAKGFRLDLIKESDIELPGSGEVNFAVKFMSSLDRFKMRGRQDRFFYKCYMSGTRLRFCEPGANWDDGYNGSLVLRSVVLPNDPGTMSKTLMPELAIVIADLARKQIREQNRGLNRPPK